MTQTATAIGLPASTPEIKHQFIGGRWVDATDGRRYADHDPYHGTLFAEVPASGRRDAEGAIQAASDAFRGWAATTPIERQTIFLRAADLLEARTDEVCRVLTSETGATQGFARFQARRSVDSLRAAAGWPALAVGEVLRSAMSGRLVFTTRHPLGVVFGITPWNGAHILG